MSKVLLSTKDNPFDPFIEFDKWFLFDESNGHHTSGLLARVLEYSDELADADKERIIEAAVDELLEVDPNGNLIKVVQPQA